MGSKTSRHAGRRFDILVQRLANGDSARQLAKYCQGVKPEIAFETYRKWVQALARVVSVCAAENKIVSDGQKAIGVYYEEKEKLLKKLAPLKTVHEAELVKEHVTAFCGTWSYQIY